MRLLSLVALLFDPDDGVDGLGEDLVYTAHLLAAALDVGCAHALRDAVALLRGDGR